MNLNKFLIEIICYKPKNVRFSLAWNSEIIIITLSFGIASTINQQIEGELKYMGKSTILETKRDI